MAVNVWGIVAIVVFYVIIFVIGVWAGRKSKGIGKNANAEDLMLAGRNIGPFLGIFTLTGKRQAHKLNPCHAGLVKYKRVNLIL